MASWSFLKENNGTLLVGRYAGQQSKQINDTMCQTPRKLAAFDLDLTLIDTISGKLHACSAADWKWWHPSVPLKLRALAGDNYSLVIFTNQGRLTTATGAEALECTTFKEKVDAVIRDLGLPITVYAACANDLFRKPRTGMWEFMCAELGTGRALMNGTINEQRINNHASWQSIGEAYLVGDAAGRDGDHSDCDIHFCENLGLKFFTPEEFFLGDETVGTGHKFHPKWYLPPSLGGIMSKGTHGSVHEDSTRFQKSKEVEIVLLAGLPGSGKTTYYREVLQPLGYERINQHALRTMAECSEGARQIVVDGKSVVIDEINSSVSIRQQWVVMAQRLNIQIRALYFDTVADLCLHNDSVRALAGPLVRFVRPSFTALPVHEARPIFPRTQFLKLQSGFQEPTVEEGFEAVIKVAFEWRGSDDELKIWSRHWL